MTLVPHGNESSLKDICNGLDSISSTQTIIELNETDER